MVVELRRALRHDRGVVCRIVGVLPCRLDHRLDRCVLPLREHIRLERADLVFLGELRGGLPHHLGHGLLGFHERLGLAGALGFPPFTGRQFRLPGHSSDGIVLRPVPLALGQQPSPRTQRHARTHRSTGRERVGHRLPIHVMPVADGVQCFLGTFLNTLTEGVDDHARHQLRVLLRTDRRAVQVVSRELGSGATLAQRGAESGGCVLHHLAGRQRRGRHPAGHRDPVLHHEPHTVDHLDVTVLRLGSGQRAQRTLSPGALPCAHLRGALHDAAAEPQLQHVHADTADSGGARAKVEVALLVEEDRIVLTHRIVERLAPGERQLTDATADLGSHLSSEQHTARCGAEQPRTADERGPQIRRGPQTTALLLPRGRVDLVVRRLPVALLAPTDAFGIRGTVDHVAQRVQGVSGETCPTLERGRQSCRVTALTRGHLGLDLHPSRLILDLVAVHARTDATGDRTDHSAGQRTPATEHRANACASHQTTDHTTRDRLGVGFLLIPGFLLAVDVALELLHLLVIAAVVASTSFAGHLRVVGVLFATLVNAVPIGLLGGAHHHRSHDGVSTLLAIGVVEVLLLHATLEDIAELDAGFLVIPESNAILLVAEPVERVTTLRHGIVVVTHEGAEKLCVEPVGHAVEVLAGGQLGQVLSGVLIGAGASCFVVLGSTGDNASVPRGGEQVLLAVLLPAFGHVGARLRYFVNLHGV